MDKRSELLEKLYETLRNLQEAAPPGYNPNSFVADWFYRHANEEALTEIIADAEKDIASFEAKSNS